MEGCLGASNSGSVSPETVRRWIVNVENVLSTHVGRQKFQDFLQNCNGFEEGIQLITFWEMCHNLVPDEETISKKRKKKRWYSSQKEVDEAVFNQANEVLSFANENINVDPGHLERISSAIENKNYKQLMSSIFEVKKEAGLLLERYHALFKENLLQQQGFTHSS
ncbi:Protein of unknown function [Gryllus bimaculatus]|nr:Protein of unknown function [Gryllus bimaculatus]